MQHRVVVTGMGCITPLGNTVESFWAALKAGQSGIGPITRFDASEYATRFAGEVKDFNPADYLDKKEARRMDRFTQFALVATKLAWADAGLKAGEFDPERAGVYMGSGIGGLETLGEEFQVLHTKGHKRVSPFLIPMMISNMAAGQAAILFGLQGPNMTTVTACSSGNNAIGEAFHTLQAGRADVMIAGGSEAVIHPIAVAGFSNMKALSERNDEPTKASRPFDAGRDGFVMGEGAGMLVLETLEHAQQHGATIYAELIGYGHAADAYHMVQPPENGAGGARSMRRALQDAGIQPEQVHYINAHATSTPQGDIAEVAAIKSVFGEHAYKLAVSSTKSMHGHLLGAAGAVELIATIQALREQILPPTINQETPDPACDLDVVPNVARAAHLEIALSNSFGFGGQNASLVVKRYAPA